MSRDLIKFSIICNHDKNTFVVNLLYNALITSTIVLVRFILICALIKMLHVIADQYFYVKAHIFMYRLFIYPLVYSVLPDFYLHTCLLVNMIDMK